MKTLYEVLDIPPGSTIEAIRNRYHTLARSMHPDAGGDTQAFADIAEAYSTLTDIPQRLAYDKKLSLLMDPCPSCGGSGLTMMQVSFTQTVSRRCRVCSGRGFHDRR